MLLWAYCARFIPTRFCSVELVPKLFQLPHRWPRITRQMASRGRPSKHEKAPPPLYLSQGKDRAVYCSSCGRYISMLISVPTSFRSLTSPRQSKCFECIPKKVLFIQLQEEQAKQSRQKYRTCVRSSTRWRRGYDTARELFGINAAGDEDQGRSVETGSLPGCTTSRLQLSSGLYSR